MVFFQNVLGPFRQTGRPPKAWIVEGPSSQQLTWIRPPMNILVIKKAHDPLVVQPFLLLVEWLANFKNMIVFVEEKVIREPAVSTHPSFVKFEEKLKTFDESKDDLTDRIDLVVCLGGDGTLLYASSLFKKSAPPLMAFHLGSLGFLAPFKFENFDEQVSRVLEGHATLTLRSRLRSAISPGSGREEIVDEILVLNEVVIDRGPSPFLTKIDLYLDDRRVTTVQGDGLIISTPTGSTAYAGSAGASMVHPSVSAILITPICPHSLSFRPIMVPAWVELKIAVNPDSRSSAWVSFDGHRKQEIKHGGSVRITTSIYPLPSVCSRDQDFDWFDSLRECFQWNVRRTQREADELSDNSRTRGLSQRPNRTQHEKGQPSA